jgi:hypothetical protein
MRLQVLVVTRGQNDHRLVSQMNLQCDAIFGNQCDRHTSEIFCYNGYTIRYESRAECGVGFNRNTVWMYADADICLFADDDVRYWNGYTERVLAEFVRHPEADVILFTAPIQSGRNTRFQNGRASTGTMPSAMAHTASLSARLVSNKCTLRSPFCSVEAPAMAPGKIRFFYTTVASADCGFMQVPSFSAKSPI